MELTKQIAKHFRDVHFGGNWTVSNLRGQVKDVTWEQAIKQVHTFNTIATLVYHTHYFVHTLLEVLEGNPLDAHDKFSFDHPAIASEEDWQRMLAKVWADAESAAVLIEQLPESRLGEGFAGMEKYGTYYRNIQGIIEHTHYHLGQIALIKKLVQEG